MTTASVVEATARRQSDNTWRQIREIGGSFLEPQRAEVRYARLVRAIHALVPCDSAVLLRLVDDALLPVACEGLAPECLSQRFVVEEHPRLAQFVRGFGPVRITDHELPDPFDGLIGSDKPLSRVHACLGLPLRVDSKVIGVLVFDALDERALDGITDDQMAAVAALCAAAMQLNQLSEALERKAHDADNLVRDLVRDASAPAARQLVGQSAAIAAVREEIALAGHSDLAVLITGETGVGKEVVARAIHAASARADRPLIYVNCAALPETIAESELFGHLRGAFTGASEHRAGKFEVADGGTLFLDEIGELPLSIQPKLLRALQSGEIQRVGSDKLLSVDVRIIAATNRDLPEEVAVGRFRSDLYHRLSVYPIRVAPLREHREDISLLTGFFLDEARLRLGLGRIRLTAAARLALEQADWPGNVRELEHTILRAALRASGGRRRELVVIDGVHIGLVGTPARREVTVAPVIEAVPVPLHDAMEAFKRQQIEHAIEVAGGNWAKAARLLGLDRGNLHRLAHRLGISPEKTRETCVVADDA